MDKALLFTAYGKNSVATFLPQKNQGAKVKIRTRLNLPYFKTCISVLNVHRPAKLRIPFSYPKTTLNSDIQKYKKILKNTFLYFYVLSDTQKYIF
jgi:hypothetical protein